MLKIVAARQTGAQTIMHTISCTLSARPLRNAGPDDASAAKKHAADHVSGASNARGMA